MDKKVEEWRKKKYHQLEVLYEINDHGKAFLSPRIRTLILGVFVDDPDLVMIDREKELLQVGWFWKNCKQQRCKPAKICLECPFVDCRTGKVKHPPVISLTEALREYET